jgi:hypothetical protein
MAKNRRNVGKEVLDGIREIKHGEFGRVISVPDIAQASENTDLSPARLAEAANEKGRADSSPALPKIKPFELAALPYLGAVAGSFFSSDASALDGRINSKYFFTIWRWPSGIGSPSSTASDSFLNF